MLNFLWQSNSSKTQCFHSHPTHPPAQGHAFLGGQKITNEWQDDKKQNKTLKFLCWMSVFQNTTVWSEWSWQVPEPVWGTRPDAMSLPHFPAWRLSTFTSESRCCNGTENKIRKTADFTPHHSDTLWMSMFSATQLSVNSPCSRGPRALSIWMAWDKQRES